MGTLTKFDNNKILFILCDCQSEILYIEYDPEIKLADFCFYYYKSSGSNRLSFWQKIRYIWQIIWNHKPYSDQMILNHSQLKSLQQFLESLKLS